MKEKFNIDLKRSFMIGDDISDIKAGKNAGCKTIFLGNIKYYYFKKMEEDQSFPDFSVTSLQDAVNLLK
jgi:histidinol phosphatase-like enzyme